MGSRGRVRVEDGPKRVRIFHGGHVVADTTRVKLVWEVPYYPTYYFHPDDVTTAWLTPSGQQTHSQSRGDARVHDVTTPSGKAPGAAFEYAGSPIDEIDGWWAFNWAALDEWFEEDEPVIVHARDPYTRVDILQSSRHVEILIDDVTVADSTSPRLLFETGLPTRYYLPKTDVRMDLLTPTDLHTGCPYKGEASYYSVDTGASVHDNIVWWYPTPLPESGGIAGMVAFYNEKVTIIVDGEVEEQPKTKFS